jgi:type VI protein secretion system component VasF
VEQLNDSIVRADLVEHLRWLQGSDENALSSDQKEIRDDLRRRALPAWILGGIPLAAIVALFFFFASSAGRR